MSERQPFILVVDDNDMNRDLLARRLQRKGFDVIAADSGASALEIISQQRFDIVVLDWMMPDMSGLEALRELRKTYSPAVLPVIMATARSAPEDMVLGLESGANDYVTKPIDFDVLVARMRVHLRTGKQASEQPKAPTGPITTGSIIDGRYELGETIGSGGFGTVYRAKHIGLDAPVAVKLLHAALATNDRVTQKFMREGMSACRVRHPNAVTMLDTGMTGAGVPYLVMELLEGRSLYDELAGEGILRVSRAAEIAFAMCDVLARAHEAGIVHRDIKPANVFLAVTPRGEQVKVVDFGIATLIEADTGHAPVTQGGEAGTPQYMSRERLLGLECDGRADVYSVGATLYEMLTGTLPFGREAGSPIAQALKQLNESPTPISEMRPDLPPELCTLVMSALADFPAGRPSMSDLRDAIGEWRGDRWIEPVWPLPLTTRRRIELAHTAASISSGVVPKSDEEQPSTLPDERRDATRKVKL